MRSTAVVTVSLPAELASRADAVAKEESRTRSELLREALRLYIDTREVRRRAVNQELSTLVDRVQGRTRQESPARIRSLIREAVRGVRSGKTRPQRRRP
jgi:metal-responsive CopG/Arc/MetJ family transcriptional regulator